jgi:hypothetical protein
MSRARECWLELPDETPELAAAVPTHLLPGLRAYGTSRVEPGRFLRAVLENDLQGAIARADPESLAAMRGICQYVFNALPGLCWGSKEKVAAWLAQGETAKAVSS